uniref:Uncharacterized protein n=1 Tax=Davidia involucrata TaxID=16924 RepID=A0A5B6Z9R9_DAVIN
MAARNALLKYLRVNARPLPQNPSPFALSFGNLLRRHFSEEARGSFLDKSEVTDRVISVVKNFQKVDPSKEGNRTAFLFQSGGGLLLRLLESIEARPRRQGRRL